MYFLDALEYYRNTENLRDKYSEYEVLCRIHLTGTLDFGCVYLQFWEVPPLEENNVRSVYLKINAIQENITKNIPPKNEQYYIPGGLPNEIVILMTLFTRSHFVLARKLRESGILLMTKYAAEEDVSRGDIDGKTLSVKDVKPYFSMLEELKLREDNDKVRRLQPFMLAAKFYHQAFSLIHRDETLSYISLVSAIESLLHDYKIDMKLEQWNPKAARLIKQAVSADKFEEIKQAMLIKPIRIKHRFIEFIKEHITEKFWSDTTRPNKIESARFKNIADIEKYLGRIYDARSDTLHEGKPFPPSDRFGERPLGLGAKVGWQKEWKEKELLPQVRAFERIVHHVLMEYLLRESAKGKNNQ